MNISKIKVGNTTYDIKDSSMEGVGQTVNSIDSKIDVISSKIDLIQVSTSGSGDGIPEDYYITSYIIDMSDYKNVSSHIVKDIPSVLATDTIMVGNEAVYVDVIKRIWSETKLYARDTTKDGFVVRELSRTDKTKFIDGTSSTNTNYEYLQKMPEFWYKTEEIRANVYKVSFTMTSNVVDSTWSHWSGNKFIGIYPSSIKNYSAYSANGSSWYYKNQFSIRNSHGGMSTPDSSLTYPIVSVRGTNYYSGHSWYDITNNGDKIGEERILNIEDYKLIFLLFYGMFCQKYELIFKMSDFQNEAVNNYTSGAGDAFGMNFGIKGDYREVADIVSFFGLEFYDYCREAPDDIAIRFLSDSNIENRYRSSYLIGGSLYIPTLQYTYLSTSGVITYDTLMNHEGLATLLYLDENLIVPKFTITPGLPGLIGLTVTQGSGSISARPLMMHYNASMSSPKGRLFAFTFTNGTISSHSLDNACSRKCYEGEYTEVDSF